MEAGFYIHAKPRTKFFQYRAEQRNTWRDARRASYQRMNTHKPQGCNLRDHRFLGLIGSLDTRVKRACGFSSSVLHFRCRSKHFRKWITAARETFVSVFIALWCSARIHQLAAGMRSLKRWRHSPFEGKRGLPAQRREEVDLDLTAAQRGERKQSDVITEGIECIMTRLSRRRRSICTMKGRKMWRV